MTSRRELKNYAKQAMSGKYGILILAFVAVQALALISSMISSALFPGEETIDIVLSYSFTFILTLLINVVAAGMNYMYLNIARGKAYSLNDLFYFYRHHPDRVIVAGFFMAVLNLLTMLPYTIYSNANLPGEDASVEVLITWLYTGVVLMIVGMIVYQILVIPLEMTYYILADKPELKSTEAMKESLEMMHGNFGKYLMLKLSFVPLMFLSVFTFYIALLWILPYMEMTEVMFYRDLLGELTAQKEEELVILQRNILDKAAEYVKPRGVLIFSTCTIAKEENEENMMWFMNNHPFKLESIDEFVPDELKSETTRLGYLQLLPGVHGTDGFFMAKFRRK